MTARILTSARTALTAAALALISPSTLLGQTTTPTVTNPWETAVTALRTAMTGTIAQGLALVAIVVGGLMFAFGEGGSKRTLAGIIFGLGMALGAANFSSWLFGVP